VLHRALRADLTLRNTVLQSVAERKQWRLAAGLLQQQAELHPDIVVFLGFRDLKTISGRGV